MFLQQTITTWGEIAALAKLIELYPKKLIYSFQFSWMFIFESIPLQFDAVDNKKGKFYSLPYFIMKPLPSI